MVQEMLNNFTHETTELFDKILHNPIYIYIYANMFVFK